MRWIRFDAGAHPTRHMTEGSVHNGKALLMRKLFALAALAAALVLPAASTAYNDTPGGAIQCHWVCGYTMDGYRCVIEWW
jgi:hypothetical protein